MDSPTETPAKKELGLWTSTALAQLVLLRKIQQPMDKPTLLRSPIIALLALLYSLWAICDVGPDALFWGLVLILADIPVYVWLHRQPS